MFTLEQSKSLNEVPGPACLDHAWHGDDYCDDFLNTEECEWDGGDCCQENPASGWDNYCQVCECLEVKECDDIGGETIFGMISCILMKYLRFNIHILIFYTYQACECLEPKCDYPDHGWNGDNYCDDFLNTAACGYDGGDCCGEDVDTTYCTVS